MLSAARFRQSSKVTSGSGSSLSCRWNPAANKLTFCLGGYTQEDWNEYWVYANGMEIGHWKKSGRWREPEQLALRADSPVYGRLRFGGGKKNLLAIRAYQCDKSFEGLPDEILDRFIFEQRLSDQFIAVGQPYATSTISTAQLAQGRKRRSMQMRS